jgi:hypothetical protein
VDPPVPARKYVPLPIFGFRGRGFVLEIWAT